MALTYKRKNTSRLAAINDPDYALPSLTKKQEAFANAILSGSSAVEAYKLAYDASGMNSNTLNCEAWKLKTSPQIAQYMRFFQRNGLDERKVSLENHLADLARLRELAVEERQISAGVQAEHYRGKVSGLYEDKFRLNIGLDDSVLLAQLSTLLGDDTVKLVAQGLGVEPKPATLLIGHGVDEDVT
jgi:phage terminase small subunit